jgi:hypothetical protein
MKRYSSEEAGHTAVRKLTWLTWLFLRLNIRTEQMFLHVWPRENTRRKAGFMPQLQLDTPRAAIAFY